MKKIIREESRDMPASGRKQQWTLVGCVLAFCLGFLVLMNPVARASQLRVSPDLSLPAGFNPPAVHWLTIWGGWLPKNLHLAADAAASIYRTADLEFLLLVAFVVVVYLFTLYFVARRLASAALPLVRLLIWIGAVVVGVLLILLPGMISKDIFAYASYANILARYGANPYFVLPNQVAPADPLTPVAEWSGVTSAYGPLWNVVSAGLTLLLGDSPLHQFYGYRVLGLVVHLVSIFLVGAVLRRLTSNERVVTLGMLLYAWSPLALLESILGGHNDAFMVPFILLGILLAVRAFQRDLLRPANYVPAVALLTLAMLIKFTACLPVGVFLILLAIKALGPLPEDRSWRRLHWGAAIKHLIIGGLTLVVILLVAYLPFFIGHSLQAILKTFSGQPSEYQAQNSLMKVAVLYLNAHPQGHGLLHIVMTVLAAHVLWSLITALGMLVTLAFCLRRLWLAPTLRTYVLCALFLSTVLLVLTPWFYPWYLLWLLPLAALLLAFPLGRRGRALFVFVLTFTISALATYIDTDFFHRQLLFRYLIVIVPPLLLGLLAYYRPARKEAGSSIASGIVDEDRGNENEDGIGNENENRDGNKNKLPGASLQK